MTVAEFFEGFDEGFTQEELLLLAEARFRDMVSARMDLEEETMLMRAFHRWVDAVKEAASGQVPS